MSCKIPIQPSGIIGGNLGALATVEGLTPIVLTAASHVVGNRYKNTRKSRGGNMGTVALPALLVVANHQVYKMLGKSKTVKGGRRGRRYSKKVRGGDDLDTKIKIKVTVNNIEKNIDGSKDVTYLTQDTLNKASAIVVKWNTPGQNETADNTQKYNFYRFETDGKRLEDVKTELSGFLRKNISNRGVYYIPKTTY